MTKLSISDVLRHIITGALFVVGLICLLGIDHHNVENILKGDWWVWVIIIVVCYPLGIFFQSLNRFFEETYLKKDWIVRSPFSKYFIKWRCYQMKNEVGKDVPEWIQTSSQPEKIVECVEMEIENKKNANINEYFYFCEFFQGLFIATIILLLIFFGLIFVGDHDIGDINLQIAIGCLIAFLITSYLLARFYAKQFIHSLDTYKDVLDLNINKYMCKFGVQRVFVMMRTHNSTKKEYLRDSIGSVFKQDYYDINLVILEDSKYPMMKDYICNICAGYKEKKDTIRLLYYYRQCGNPAEASYSIRDIILKVADRNDDIIFILDDDDMFAHSYVISDVVCQMNNKKANICLVKYNIIGESERNIARNGGITHNNLTTWLYNQHKALDIKQAPYLCFAASLGWSKIYRMETLRKYFLMINEARDSAKKKEIDLKLVSYEDFPDFLTFLLKGTRVTGINEPAYLYRKHNLSATQNISKEAFQEWRIDQLRLLSYTSKWNSGELRYNYCVYLNYYLLTKQKEIVNVINKYNNEKRLTDYSGDEFRNDLSECGLRGNEDDKYYKQLEREMDNNKLFVR